MTKLWINEIFETIQGEGAYTGTPAVFIRLQGCPVGCSWCDTKHTWDVLPENLVSSDIIMLKKQDDPNYFESSGSQLFTFLQAQAYTAKHVVITGGEPCMFDLHEFTQLLIDKGYTVQIETSGTYEVKCAPQTWVTVSPKINMKGGMDVLYQAMVRANEIKHPIAMQKHIDELDTLLLETQTQAKLNQTTFDPLIYIQPISQQQRATELAVKVCIQRNWRLSVQLHKYIGVE